MFLALFPGLAWGQPLVDGMSREEVLSFLGPPREKHEFEAKRRVVWRYEDKELVFSEGRLIGPSVSRHEPLNPPSIERITSRRGAEPERGSASLEILQMLEENFPGGPEGTASTPSVNALPPMSLGAGVITEDGEVLE